MSFNTWSWAFILLYVFRNFLSYHWGINFAPIELRNAYFSLNTQKTAKTGDAGTTCTGTTLTCTGTGSVLEGCTSTGLGCTGTVWLLHHLYRYRFKGVPVQVSEICPEMVISPFFMHFSSIILFYFSPHQKST